MKPIRDAYSFGRFLSGLPAYLRRRMTLEEAHEILHARMAARESNFLSVIRHGVFESPGSPYRQLFDMAGYRLADVEDLVRRSGIEGALRTLREAEVYVSFEEFKGRTPIERGGREIPTGEHAFDNPFLTRYYKTSTGGSTGRGSPVAIDIDHLWARVPQQIIADSIQGYTGAPLAIWFDGLPGNALNTILTRVPFGNVPERWFTPTAGKGARPAAKFRLAEQAILGVVRASGVAVPRAQAVSLDRADVIARWAEEALARHGRCGIKTLMSRALRVCLAADDLGIDLTGLTISGGGEPPTAAKVRAIEQTGARVISNYHFQEAGAIGLMCANPIQTADHHLLRDHLAMITAPRQVPGFDITVEAFCFTTLLPSARKLMLNVETDDYGIVEDRECGCPWEAFGFTTHIREVRSFRKLTGEGVTLIGNDMVHILESVLPERFGGSPLDYQLHEEEDERGLTRLTIVVSPSVDLEDERAVVDAVLEGVRESGHAGAIAGAIWAQAGTLRVRRAAPTWTRRGKLMPLHLGRATRQQPPTDDPADPPGISP